ncbi:MAG: GtrA family protein [Marinagarivorans sp.]|nr:GtrA family protein [Marinagarivorans sp.]
MIQLIKFSIVGAVATLTHYCVALISIEALHINYLASNGIAYAAAVGCSYTGHTLFTFKTKHTNKKAMKFIAASLTAFALSQVTLHFLTIYTDINHRLIFLFIVLSIPIFSFLLNKFWVYR